MVAEPGQLAEQATSFVGAALFAPRQPRQSFPVAFAERQFPPSWPAMQIQGRPAGLRPGQPRPLLLLFISPAPDPAPEETERRDIDNYRRPLSWPVNKSAPARKVNSKWNREIRARNH